ncbi:hypothetical protein JQ617_15565 [Bradyrhizobium sp. KB893862 SZCCT0404]|uniref:hypothetical protein n=1 Tax=Bradyrhizobium sp. KB893862 SZCCT0404 TaxID=2807672 RepID=UPI001BA65434|nr:hypothetical protein [Bradyrhizobium sp. KB893862 SZCCT0404]MBR1175380.1 hypothetical protein [Bradyrhizobium sp. KB893862 SZCCT0404]
MSSPLSDLLPYAQVISTVAAAAGLSVSAYQAWRGRKSVTLQHLQDFQKAMIEREAALAAAAGDEAKQRHALIEFMNFLEIYSAGINAGLFVGVAHEIVQDKIVGSIVELTKAPQWHEEIDRSITSSTTYKHLLHFMKVRRDLINSGIGER